MVEDIWCLLFSQAEVDDFFGFKIFLDHSDPCPNGAICGSLWQSQQSGQHKKKKQKYSSIQKVRSLNNISAVLLQRPFPPHCWSGLEKDPI
jgi:hypothetical protein